MVENKNPFLQLEKIFDEEIVATKSLVCSVLQVEDSRCYEVFSHLTKAGGKWIRPLLVLSVGRLLGAKLNNDFIKLAAAVEIIHTATLLHDDVIDGGVVRRGIKTANSIWGNHISILAGDFLLAKAFQILADFADRIVKDAAETAGRIAEGEIMQLAERFNLLIDEGKCLKISKAKTAELFALSCRAAAILAQADLNKVNKVSDYGFNLGMAFQLADDLLDYKSDLQVSGKNIGQDFFEGKITLPVCIAFNADTETANFLKTVFSEKRRSKKQFKETIEALQKTRSFDKTAEKALAYAESAVLCLEGFSDSEIKKLLINVVFTSALRKA